MNTLKETGQTTMEVLMNIPIIVIGLLIAFILLGPIGEVLFTTLESSCSEVIANIAIIKVLVSLIGLVIVAMAIVRIVNSFREPRYPTGGTV